MTPPGPKHDSEAELKELVGRALAAARKRESELTADDVASIAAELGIAPEDVAHARAELAREREQSALRAADRVRRARRVRRWAMVGGAVVAVAGFGWAAKGAAKLGKAEADALAAQGRLEAVLDRQARLVPQVLALVAGDVGSLSAVGSAIQNSTSMEERLAASRALSTAIAKEVARLRPQQAAGVDERWRDLGYELTGAENRISVETQRWRDRMEAWRAASSGFGAQLACLLRAARCLGR